MMARSPLLIALGGMLVMAVVMGVGRFVYTPILPFMIEAGALDRAQAGLVAGANYLGYLVGALAAGSRFLKGPRRAWMLGGLLLSVITTALMAYGDFSEQLVIRFVAGVASAFAMIFVSSIVFDLAVRTSKPYLSAIQFSGVGLGIALSAYQVSASTSSAMLWPDLWSGAALFSCIGGVIAMGLIGHKRSRSETAVTVGETAASNAMVGSRTDLPASSDFSLSPTIAVALLIVGYGLFGYGYIITATFISELAASTPALSETKNIVWLVVGLSAFTLTWPATLAANRLGNLRAFALFCVLEGIGVGISVLILEPWAILVAAALLGATFITITVLGLRAANEIIKRVKASGLQTRLARWDERTAVSLMTASFGTGQVLGPLVAGYLFEITGTLRDASLSAVAALMISALLAVAIELGLRTPRLA